MKRTKLKTFAIMGLTAIMATISTNMSAFANSSSEIETSKLENAKIDYSIYDSDLEYIPEHAERIAEYNESIRNSRSTSYAAWSWSNGMYSHATGRASGIVIPYYFIPITNYLYFNVEVEGSSTTPYLTINTYNANGTLGYIGSYNITSEGNNTYIWDNKKRSLNAGTKYVFALLNNTNWSSASIDINKSSF